MVKVKFTNMKKEFIIFFMYPLFFFFFCCKGNMQKNDVDSNDVKSIAVSSIEKLLLDTTCFKKPQIVVLETTKESLLSEIKKIAMDDSILFVCDKYSNKLFMFDVNGKFVNKIDSKGNGPKEYIQTVDFTIDPMNKQIILLCAIPEKRMYFTYKGEFIKEERNSAFFSSIATDSKYIYLEDDSRDKNNQLYILNKETGIGKVALKTINVRSNLYLYGNAFSQNKSILLARRFDNSVYELKNGEVIEKYRIDFKSHSFPQELIEEEKEEKISEECRTHNYVYSMSNVIESDNYMMFYTNLGIFLYDKRKNELTGNKQILNSKLMPVLNYPLYYYLPVGNTDMFACPIDEPAFIKHIAKQISNHLNKPEVKEIQSKYPGLIEEIINIGNRMTEDNNPLLIIYEFKE